MLVSEGTLRFLRRFLQATDEELSSIGSTTAVGRAGDVSGGIEIDGTTLTAATSRST